jgi:hypothetical protein|tara:strand:+ start:791 stop:3304 length:2514 start_codon:yes stop_codon:yes gene_type:complete
MADESKNNIERALGSLTDALEVEPTGQEIQLEDDVVEKNVEIMEDGGALIGEQSGEELDTANIPHNANLADYIDDTELMRFSGDLINDFEADKDSRKDWEDSYVKGLDMLGFKYENRTQPFEGASGVVHPLLAESVTQFQAQAYKELLPPSGPVRTQVIGLSTPEVQDQAKRVQQFMNYQLTEVMQEYDPDMDQLLFYLPLSGSAFKKIYYDALLKRACAKFITGEDLVINYMATDLENAGRITHVIKTSGNDIRKQQLQGFYRDIAITTGQVETSEVKEKVDTLEGLQREYGQDEDEHTLLEMHVNSDVPGFEDETGVKLPYIITIDQYSGEILSIRKNWKEKDPDFRKISYFVHYKFLPGLGFYGFGLIHMLGGLSRTATSVLRQLIDAGTLANLPAGFKARGMRIRDDDTPLQPGEFRDVDVTGASIKESLMPLPYKEPSQTLFQLLGFAVDAGKSFAAIADMKMGEGNQQNPVGTTLALLERGTKVMSAIHKRLHYAQKIEFKLLAKVFQLYLPPEYPYQVVGGNQMIKQQDFDDRVDVIPVSDPNIFSMAQRVTLAQQQLQLATANPGLHNMREAYRRMYDAMGVDNVDSILKPDPEIPQPMSPATENAGAMNSKPPKAFPPQDHQAHIQAHAEFMFTRMVQINPQIYSLLQSHICEHISLMAGLMVQEEFKQQDEQLKQAKQQAQQNPQMAQQVEQQMEQLINQKAAKQAKIEAEMTKKLAADEEARMSKEAQDPLVKLKQQELDLKAMETQMKVQKDMMVEGQKIDIERDRLETEATIDVMKMAAEVNKEDSDEAMILFKENMINSREAMKSKADEKIARANGRSKTKGD